MGLPPLVELCIPIASDDESFAPHDDVVLRDPPAARSFPHDVDNTDRYVDKSPMAPLQSWTFAFLIHSYSKMSPTPHHSIRFYEKKTG